MSLRENGYFLPAEWETQEAVWLTWPVHPGNWPGQGKFQRIQTLFAEIACHISRHQTLRVNAAAGHHPAIRKQLESAGSDMPSVELFDHPANDVWCRDHGPIFLKNRSTGERIVTSWNFNGWGGNFTPYDLDAAIPARVAGSLGLPLHQSSLTLEGGSIEPNGAGTLVTTEAVLLNANRNPGATRESIESLLADDLAIDRVLWLRRGIEGDDTGGHIDDMVRFVEKRTVLAATESDPAHPNYPVLDDNLRRLRQGEPKLEIIELPNPHINPCPGSRLPALPASYANFLILNNAVLVPVFGQPLTDARAISTIAGQFPDRKAIPVNCLDLVTEGGALHCISMQQPA